MGGVAGSGLAVVVLALGAGIAWAATTRYPTVFTEFKATTPTYAGFKGQIDSSKGRCVKKRKVKIFHKHNPSPAASGKTNSKGKFEIAVTGEFKGRYYAKVKRKELDNGDKVCRGAESKTIKV